MAIVSNQDIVKDDFDDWEAEQMGLKNTIPNHYQTNDVFKRLKYFRDIKWNKQLQKKQLQES